VLTVLVMEEGSGSPSYLRRESGLKKCEKDRTKSIFRFFG
jgi:hypothetical protein